MEQYTMHFVRVLNFIIGNFTRKGLDRIYQIFLLMLVLRGRTHNMTQHNYHLGNDRVQEERQIAQ